MRILAKRAPRAGSRCSRRSSAIAIVGMTSVSALEAVGRRDAHRRDAPRRAIEAEALATSRLDFMDLLTDASSSRCPTRWQKGKFPAPLDGVHVDHDVQSDLRSRLACTTSTSRSNWANGSYPVRTYRYRHPLAGDSPMMRARRGMTLMELVIGLAITGMMAAAGAGAFESIIDHRQRDSRRGRLDGARRRAARDDSLVAVDGHRCRFSRAAVRAD